VPPSSPIHHWSQTKLVVVELVASGGPRNLLKHGHAARQLNFFDKYKHHIDFGRGKDDTACHGVASSGGKEYT
jgi:hypothetical protein